MSIPTRPSPAIEAICYFCAAELLANVAQHAQASRAFLTCAQHGPWLRIVVRDNGRGGAALDRLGLVLERAWPGWPTALAPSTGTSASPARRVAPTAITVDLPCPRS